MKNPGTFANPCHGNVFDVFLIDKSETDVRVIREELRNARDRLEFDKFRTRDGRRLTLSEAELNRMEAILLDPLQRLQAEQFVHQAHLFSEDEELARCLTELTLEEEDPIDDLLSTLEQALLRMIVGALPPPEPCPIEDDLPWPNEPGSCPPQLETLEEAILRDR